MAKRPGQPRHGAYASDVSMNGGGPAGRRSLRVFG